MDWVLGKPAASCSFIHSFFYNNCESRRDGTENLFSLRTFPSKLGRMITLKQLPRPRLPYFLSTSPSQASSSSISISTSTEDNPSRSSSTSSLQLAFLPQPTSVMDESAVPTYFHTLSEDCHLKIINFVDDPEESRAEFRREALISLLFSPVSPFLDSASTLFHTIILDADRPLNCVVSRGVIELGCTNNDFYMVPYVLRRVGEHVGRIEVVASGINSYESYVALLLQHCSCNVIKGIEFFGGELDDNFQASIEVLIGCFRDKLTSVEFPSYSNLCTSEYLGKLVATCRNLREVSQRFVGIYRRFIGRIISRGE